MNKLQILELARDTNHNNYGCNDDEYNHHKQQAYEYLKLSIIELNLEFKQIINDISDDKISSELYLNIVTDLLVLYFNFKRKMNNNV